MTAEINSTGPLYPAINSADPARFANSPECSLWLL